MEAEPETGLDLETASAVRRQEGDAGPSKRILLPPTTFFPLLLPCPVW